MPLHRNVPEDPPLDGGSVNDGIRDTWCSLSYAMMTDATHRITSY